MRTRAYFTNRKVVMAWRGKIVGFFLAEKKMNVCMYVLQTLRRRSVVNEASFKRVGSHSVDRNRILVASGLRLSQFFGRFDPGGGLCTLFFPAVLYAWLFSKRVNLYRAMRKKIHMPEPIRMPSSDTQCRPKHEKIIRR